MKKVKLCTLCLLVSILVNVPTFANNDRYGILNTSSTEVVVSPRANITYGAMVIAKGQRGYFTNNGNTYWSKTTTSGYAYMGWKVGYGTANRDYLMLVRLDSAITGTKSAYTLGLWNSW